MKSIEDMPCPSEPSEPSSPTYAEVVKGLHLSQQPEEEPMEISGQESEQQQQHEDEQQRSEEGHAEEEHQQQETVGQQHQEQEGEEENGEEENEEVSGGKTSSVGKTDRGNTVQSGGGTKRNLVGDKHVSATKKQRNQNFTNLTIWFKHCNKTCECTCWW